MAANNRSDAPDDAGSSEVGGLVRNYLTSKGLTYNPENVRRAIEANARDSTVLGPDPIQGLRNAAANTEPPSQRSRSAARDIETPPHPDSQAQQKIRPGETAGQTVTSAQPTPTPVVQPGVGAGPAGMSEVGALLAPNTDTSGVGPIGALIAAAIPLIGRYLTGNPAVGGGGIPAGAPAGAASPPPDQMTVAIDRAVEQPGVPRLQYDPAMPNYAQVAPGLNQVAPGVSNVDVANQSVPNMQVPPQPPPNEPPIPITPKAGRPQVSIEELPGYRTRPRMQLRPVAP